MGHDDATGALSGYFEAREPGRRARADAWSTAIGLQQVDGLSTAGKLRTVNIRKPEWVLRAALRGTGAESGQKKRSEKAVRKDGRKAMPDKGRRRTVERLLGLLKAEPSLAQAEMVEGLGLASRSTVQKNLATLKARGLVRRIGSDRSGRWEVV